MIKKLIGVGILVFLVVYGCVYYFKYIYVPSGEEFDLKYSNLVSMDLVGDAQEQKVEFTNHGLYTRTKFLKSGDTVEYHFDIINDGTITAELKRDPIYLKLDQYTKKHIEYLITYLDGSKIKKGDIINPGETKSFKVKITYLRDSDFADINSTFYESNTYLMFMQKR